MYMTDFGSTSSQNEMRTTQSMIIVPKHILIMSTQTTFLKKLKPSYRPTASTHMKNLKSTKHKTETRTGQ